MSPKPSKRHGEFDLVLEVRGPDGSKGLVVVEAKNSIDPVDVPELAVKMARSGTTGLVMSPYLSPRTRERLRESGLGYLDLTGNTFLVMKSPGLFVATTGESRSPSPRAKGKRSLRGPKAGRIVRMLCDYTPPMGIRALAAKTRTDPGYASRVVDILRREGLLERKGRGPVLSSNWEALIRRLSEDYALLDSNVPSSFLAPRGIPDFLAKLKRTKQLYLLTGSVAGSMIAPIAPPRLVTCYVDDAAGAAAEFDLREAETGVNVILVEPSDPLLFGHVIDLDGLRLAGLSQIVTDLLTGPGRSPQEAEELIKWMKEHENEWRAHP